MKRSLGIIITMGLLSLTTLSGCDEPMGETQGRGGFQSLTYEEAIAKAKKNNMLVMLDFGASSCPPCQMMEKHTFSNSQVKDYLKNNLVAIKVDVQSQRAMAVNYNIENIPTMVFLDGDGEEVGRMIGYRSASQFIEGAREIKRQ